MRRITKKLIASILALTLAFGTQATVFGAHAANGANIATATTWGSFSVRDDLYGKPMTDWEKALIETMDKAKADAQAKLDKGEIDQKEFDELIAQADGYQSYTQGALVTGSTPSSATLYVKNSGWDGEYNPITGDLVTDNPYGLTLQSSGSPIEKGRKYRISFNLKTTLKGKVTPKDDEGNDIIDPETQQPVQLDNYIKHIGFKAYDPVSKGGMAVEFDNIQGASMNGIIETDGSNQDGIDVVADVTIPKNYSGQTLAIMLYCGAYLKTYPEELAMKGNVTISDFKIIAGNQWTVKYSGNGKSTNAYVNGGEKTELTLATSLLLAKKGYTIDYYTLNGAKYNFNNPVNSNIELKAHYAKTVTPAKAKIAVKSKKKKQVTLTFKNPANAKGYQYTYSYNKKFKKKAKYGTKTKSTTKTTSVVIKSLKSSKVLYVKARGFNYDSTDSKVYGKWGAKKKCYVR